MTVKSPKASSAPLKRKKLLERLWSAAEKQIAEIELRLQRLDGNAAAFDDDARALALLAKLLRELVGIESLIDEAKGPSKPLGRAVLKKATAEDDDAPPRNLDDFRRELARRLDQMRSARESDGVFDQSQPDRAGEPGG